MASQHCHFDHKFVPCYWSGTSVTQGLHSKTTKQSQSMQSMLKISPWSQRKKLLPMLQCRRGREEDKECPCTICFWPVPVGGASPPFPPSFCPSLLPAFFSQVTCIGNSYGYWDSSNPTNWTAISSQLVNRLNISQIGCLPSHTTSSSAFLAPPLISTKWATLKLNLRRDKLFHE